MAMSLLLVSVIYIILTAHCCKADVIMMNQNGMPSIIDDDNFPDVILMPGMGNLIMNDDLVL